MTYRLETGANDLKLRSKQRGNITMTMISPLRGEKFMIVDILTPPIKSTKFRRES